MRSIWGCSWGRSLWSALAVALCLAPITVFADDLDALCSPSGLEATGAYKAFNLAQCALAKAPLRTKERQVGGTCVCEALLNVAYALGVDGDIQGLTSQGIDCDAGHFADLFKKFSAKNSPLAGRVFGGVGAVYAKRLTPVDEAIHDIVQAVSVGKAVAVSINPKPIYEDYAKRHNLRFNIKGFAQFHALVVRAVQRNAVGEVSHFVVLDSSGPAPIYPVPYKFFIQSYSEAPLRPLTALGRAVYISDTTVVAARSFGQ